MSKDLLAELRKLNNYPFEMEKDYVLATPELLETKEAEAYLIKEVMSVLGTEQTATMLARTLKNIITNARTHLLTKAGLPIFKIQQTLFAAGFGVKMIRMCATKRPLAVAIETKLGLVVVAMDIPLLNTATDILNWGIPE